MKRIEKEVSYCFDSNVFSELLKNLSAEGVAIKQSGEPQSSVEYYINTNPFYKEKFVLKKKKDGLIVGEYKIKELLSDDRGNYISYTERRVKNWVGLIVGGFSTNCVLSKTKTEFALEYDGERSILIFQICKNAEKEIFYAEIEFDAYPPKTIDLLSKTVFALGGKSLEVEDAKYNRFQCKSIFISVEELSDLVKLYF